MSDPNEAPGRTPQEDLSSELNRALGVVWRRHAGGKPSGTKMELEPDMIKFVLDGAVSGIGAERVDEDDGTRSPDSTRYRNEAIAAVRRITGRRVIAFIPKRDSKTDTATDTYLLEPPHVAN